MIYNYSLLVDMNSVSAHELLQAAQQQNSFTQELVVLVILVVIALALVFACTFINRDTEEKEVSTEEMGTSSRAAEKKEEVVSATKEDRLPESSKSEMIASVDATERMTIDTEPEPIVSAPDIARVEPEVEAVSPEPEVEETPAEAKLAPEAPPAEPDNLKRIEGIGPKVASLLNDAGIFTFAQLSATEVSRLKEIVDAAGLTMMNPESWPEQARLAASGDWDGLQELQDNLKGGRR